MTFTSVAALAGLLIAVAQDNGVIVLSHDLGTKYNRTDYQAACGTAVFSVRFRNGPDGHGHVDHLRVNGRPVPGAADALEVRAARRVIDRVGIMNCGMDERRPVFRGVMGLSKFESQSLGMRASHYFRLIREGDKGWKIVFD